METTEHKGGEEDKQGISTNDVGWSGMLVNQYRKIKENAETYPYVWGSYIVVYGGFTLYMAYRWRKLRKTEDRVRVLQERLRKIVAAEESSTLTTAGASSTENVRPPVKPSNEYRGRRCDGVGLIGRSGRGPSTFEVILEVYGGRHSHLFIDVGLGNKAEHRARP
ncbi:hypothetical protein F8388_018596 [Cannabis sativa]|uniref:Transmembrane protein n=2 Tax=Cannabis sativa TaxID=3483 RepID=A0A7J6FCP6_CANSA|nr:hypothetical protein F8388_018596 [Cannabis sativa]